MQVESILVQIIKQHPKSHERISKIRVTWDGKSKTCWLYLYSPPPSFISATERFCASYVQWCYFCGSWGNMKQFHVLFKEWTRKQKWSGIGRQWPGADRCPNRSAAILAQDNGRHQIDTDSTVLFHLPLPGLIT